MRRSDTVVCPHCGAAIRYGLKEEPSGWKVLAECVDPDRRHEFSCGRVPRADIEHIDTVYDRAERLLDRI